MRSQAQVGLRASAMVLVCGSCFTLPAFADEPPAKPASMPAVRMGGGPAATPKKERAAIDPESGPSHATLSADLRRYDFAGTKAAGRMYMPSSVKLTDAKPDFVTKEPTYTGKPKYGVITIGNGTPNKFAIVSEEIDSQDPKIYLDLNGDGDLTNDNTGAWETIEESKDNNSKNTKGTWVFKPGYKNADGTESVGEYALNLYWGVGREQIGYYGATAKTGKLSLGGKEYEVTLIENDGDGLFNKLYDPNKPLIVGEQLPKPVWLLLDGDQFDIRGTFSFGDLNYLAVASADGSKLTLTPTMKAIRVPRPTERVDMLPAGGEAPDFEAILWKQGQTAMDTTQRFKLSDYRGKKIVVLDMWATWCGPCMRGLPHLSKIAEKTADQDVVVIALNSYDEEKPFVNFASGKGKDYKFTFARDPAGRDSASAIARTHYRVTGIPATYIIDKSGKIVGVVSGYSEGDTKVEQYLKGLGVKID